MRLALIQPPLPYLPGEPKHLTPPLGLAYIAAAVRSAGHEVSILDCALEGYENDERWDGRYWHYGLSAASIRSHLASLSPDVVGFSCPFTTVAPAVGALASRVRRWMPDVTLLVGGTHAAVHPLQLLSDSRFDYVVTGEGEETVPALLDRLEEKSDPSAVPNLAFLVDGELRRTPTRSIVDLDELDPPARDLLQINRYAAIGRMHGETGSKRRATTLITSRGCPFDCVFCSIHSLWGYEFRAHSPSYSLNEISQLVDEYGVTHLIFEDDNLTLDRSRIKHLLGEIERRFPQITWAAPNGLSVATLDQELLELFARTGCERVSLAVESGCQETLTEIIGKPLRLECVREVVDACNRLGLETTAFFVVGLPGETWASIRKSMEFAARLPVSSISVMAASPYPGTRLARICGSGDNYAEGFDPHRLFTLNPQIETSEFTSRDIKRIIAETRIRHAARHPVTSGRRLLQKMRVAPMATLQTGLGSMQGIVSAAREAARNEGSAD